MLRQDWERLPRPVRGGSLVALGAVTALAIGRGLQAEQPVPPLRQAGTTSWIGVNCERQPATAHHFQSGATHLFRCIAPDGTSVPVSSVAQLSEQGSATSYTDAVYITSPGNTVEFSFQGNDALALTGAWATGGAARNSSGTAAIVRLSN